jgi:hypothetical protein
MKARSLSIKTRIILTLVLLPMISLVVVGAIALLQNRGALSSQARIWSGWSGSGPRLRPDHAGSRRSRGGRRPPGHAPPARFRPACRLMP